ncbi:MAG: hypothetical protein IT373_27300 [Polyangiaceae bacterium]|nr:hypothetical protein [Polyangiaceae bacterium]
MKLSARPLGVVVATAAVLAGGAARADDPPEATEAPAAAEEATDGAGQDESCDGDGLECSVATDAGTDEPAGESADAATEAGAAGAKIAIDPDAEPSAAVLVEHETPSPDEPVGCGYDCRPSDGGSFQLYGAGGYLALRDLKLYLAPGETEPDVLVDRALRVDGDGRYFGGGMRITAEGDHLRGGIDFDVFGFTGPELRHEALTPGFHATPRHLTGMNLMAFFGAEADYAPVHPYGEVWLGGQIVALDVALEHDTFGALGSASYLAFAAGFGPRVGILFELERDLHADLAAMGTIVGDAPRFGLTFGLAYFEGDRPDEDARCSGMACLE